MLLAFEALGVAALARLTPGASWLKRIWLGCCLGLAAMMWLPGLFAFFVDFTPLAQYLAMGTFALLTGLCFLLPRKTGLETGRQDKGPPLALVLALVLPLTLISAWLQYTHVLREVEGALHVGQSTYGDLCLHLGIATGLNGSSFPPEYTLLPGTLLGYPFLFDALSASMLTLGCPLAPAFTLPGTLAMGLTYLGFIMVAWEICRNKLAVTLAFLLTFLNGGLGFLYALDGFPQDKSAFFAIFTDFYRTPTNQPDLNLRWVNVICDMMVPQRTILAGWMALMPALYLLIRAMKTGKRSLFILLGLWAGILPMIHTHTFLALGLISAGAMAWQVIAARKRGEAGRTAVNYLLYAFIALCLALPQLFTWTFPQSLGSGAMGLRPGWVNNRGDGTLIDGYVWFWVKNVGPVYLLMLPAALSAPKKIKPLALGALVLYTAADLFRFQPNEYDNNKLFYAAFFAMTPLVGHLLARIWRGMKGIRGRIFIALPFMAVCLLSGTLTLGREVVSDYQLFSPAQVKAAAWIEENTPKDSLFLTGDHHNNAVSSLAGRKLVCGTDTYLHFHGVDYQNQARAAEMMYRQPETYKRLFREYGVDYIFISSHERGRYQVDEEALLAMFPLCYQDEDVIILEVPVSP